MFFFLVAILILVVSFLLALRSLMAEKREFEELASQKQFEEIPQIGSFEEEESEDEWYKKWEEPQSTQEPAITSQISEIHPQKILESPPEAPFSTPMESKRQEGGFIEELETYLEKKQETEEFKPKPPISPQTPPPTILCGEFVLPKKI